MNLNHLKTRKHSSRMHTNRLLTEGGGAVRGGGAGWGEGVVLSRRGGVTAATA